MPRVLLACCAAALACRPQAPADVVPEPAPGDAVAAVEAPREEEPLPVAASPLELLPSDTLVVAWSEHPAQSIDALGRAALVDAFGPELDMVASMAGVGSEPGQDWSPDALSEIGIDPHRTAGVAVVSASVPAAVVFAAVADEARFLRQLERDAGAAVTTAGTRGGRVAEIDDVAVAFRDGWGAVVIGDSIEVTREVAVKIADAHPARSLVATAAFSQGRVPSLAKPDATVAGGELFFSIDASMALVERELFDREAPDFSWMESEIEAARGRGASASEIDVLQRELDDMRGASESQRGEERRAFEAARRIVAGTHSLDLRFALEPQWIEVRGRIDAEPEALLGRLLTHLDAIPSSIQLADGTPVLGVEWGWDPSAFEELLGLMVQAAGSTMSEVSEETRRETGAGLEEWLAAVGGQASVLVTHASGKTKRKRKAPAASTRPDVDWLISVALRDPARARTLMDSLASRDASLTKKGSQWETEAGDVRARAAIKGAQLTLATDTDVIARVGGGGRGTAAATLEPDVARWWASGQLAGRALVSAQLGALLASAGSYRMEPAEMMTRADWRFDLTEAERERVPKSRDYRARVAAAKRSWKRVDKLEDTDEAISAERDLALARLFGGMHLVGEPDRGGYRLEGGWRFAGPTLGDTVAQAKREYERAQDLQRGHAAELGAARDELATELQRVDEARVRDVENWLRAQGRSVQPKW